jgi:hypothetical protein
MIDPLLRGCSIRLLPVSQALCHGQIKSFQYLAEASARSLPAKRGHNAQFVCSAAKGFRGVRLCDSVLCARGAREMARIAAAPVF